MPGVIYVILIVIALSARWFWRYFHAPHTAGHSQVSFTQLILVAVLTVFLSDARAGKSRCTKVIFIWAVRDSSRSPPIPSPIPPTHRPHPPGHVSWISKALKQALELAPPSLKIAVQIYVTAGEPPATSEKAYDDDSVHNENEAGGSDEKGSPAPSLSDFSAVSFNAGRPDLRAILRDEVAVAAGRMSVTGACGAGLGGA